MSAALEAVEKAYVLLRLGERQFAVPAEDVEELASAGRLERIPHTTPQIAGVIVRRKRVLAVRDVARTLTGRSLPLHRFYLVVRQPYGAATESEAIPVTGDCELLSGVVALPPGEHDPGYVAGWIDLAGEQILVLDLSQIAADAPGPAPRPAEMRA
ncbi:MAG TPA: chemotaxis protein CheW [Candidatus Binatia bacterium]|nr:chemotaxis protein CheW [Candidatus Binatia bacterium]